MASVKCASGLASSQFLLMLYASTPVAFAQELSSEPSEQIIVTGQRLLLGAQPDRVVSEDEIASYGLNSVTELVDEIARERGASTDDVIYLIDGQRVVGLGDIASYPTEAIDKIELLPRGTAVQVGGSASKQVVNIALKPKVRTIVGRVSLAHATDGDFTSHTGDVSLTDIARPRRTNLALRWRREDALLESDRSIIQAPDALSGLGQFRSLRPEVDEIELRGSVADALTPTLGALVTARLFERRTLSLLGVDGAGQPLQQASRLRSSDIDVQLNADVGNWLLTFNGAYRINNRRTSTGTLQNRVGLNSGTALTRAITRNALAEVNATGTLLDLPAGPVSITLRGVLSRNSIDTNIDPFSQSTREIGVGLQIPIASASGALGFWGDLTAGIEWSRGHTTRIGTLSNASYSLQWQPAKWVRIAGSINTGRTPPSVELVAAPLLTTPGVRYLDPLSGETINIVELSGGNPTLSASRGNGQRLSVEFRPSGPLPFVITADYSNTQNRDIITALPPSNLFLLAAFPERFVRDGNGRLTQVDARPVNFARQSDEQLRYGIDLNIPLSAGGSANSTGRLTDTATNSPPKARFSRLQLNLSHTIQLKNEVRVSTGVDAVDLLSRNSFGLSGTDRPRHEFDVSLAYAERGLGLRLTGQHRSKSFLNLTDQSDANTLRFAPLTTLNFRAFVEGQRLFSSVGWLQGSRLSLTVTNVTNSRQQVRDADGKIPLVYQPAYRDPTGRLVQLEFRKTF